MKKFQYVHIVILVLFLIGFLVSIYHALFNFKSMIVSSKESSTISSSISVLTQNKTPYPIEAYQSLSSYINPALPGVTVDIKANGIYITSPGIENEINVRQTMVAFLSLDKNLTIESICGKTNNSCNGSAFEIILKGEKTNTKLSKKEIEP